MSSKKTNPGAGSDRARKCIAVAANASEHTMNNGDYQSIGGFDAVSTMRPVVGRLAHRGRTAPVPKAGLIIAPLTREVRR